MIEKPGIGFVTIVEESVKAIKMELDDDLSGTLLVEVES